MNVVCKNKVQQVNAVIHLHVHIIPFVRLPIKNKIKLTKYDKS